MALKAVVGFVPDDAQFGFTQWVADMPGGPGTFAVTFVGTKTDLSTVTQTFMVVWNAGSPILQSFVFSGHVPADSGDQKPDDQHERHRKRGERYTVQRQWGAGESKRFDTWRIGGTCGIPDLSPVKRAPPPTLTGPEQRLAL